MSSVDGRLIDELSLVVYPGIDGLSGVPSIFETDRTPGTWATPATARRFRA